MKKYLNVYSFQVLEKVKEGKTVYCLDKARNKVLNVEFMELRDFFDMLHDSEDERNYGRFIFYYIEEEEENENGNI